MANTKAIGVAFADPAFDSVQVGSSGVPIAITSAGVLNGAYATTSATSGDTRLSYNKLTFTSTGSGEVVRGFAVVTGTGGATAGERGGADCGGPWRRKRCSHERRRRGEWSRQHHCSRAD